MADNFRGNINRSSVLNQVNEDDDIDTEKMDSLL